ncbi:hypothetical protein AAFF_G00309800 [Aldrovandia affinis]|uniref:Transposase n=1 Tax=Aldrovandia affinis TaxID=143900 RepID=A0AAD7WR20_9TELE|nr:hypothetical protein AAFF_G00309800 [Aldrovandia affinis]
MCCSRDERMEAKMAVLEDCNHRSNIRVIGLSEGSEGSDAVAFFTGLPVWFPSLVGKNCEIARPCHIYGDKNDSGGHRPRTQIFSLLRYPDRQAILQAARKYPLIMDGKEIPVFTDYSKHTAQHRKNFSQPIKHVRDNGVQAFLLYPVRLKLIHESKAHLLWQLSNLWTRCARSAHRVTSTDSNN